LLTSVLAPVEKRVLVWLAARLPAWVHSDQLTGLAFVAMLGAGLSYWLASVTPAGLWLASACLVLNWFGDSLDGTLARVRNRQRPRYGFYIDHVVDAFAAVFLIGGLALSGYMSPGVAGLLLLAYLMLCIEVYLATHSLGAFRMSYFKVGPTELRLLLMIGNATAVFHPVASLVGRQWLLFDVGGVVAAAGLFVTLIVSVVSNTRALARLEPLPRGTR
jgi:phosphatidylglycerophosphate synthase